MAAYQLPTDKAELYDMISDFSKDLNGTRMRMDINAYTVAELQDTLRRIFWALDDQKVDEVEAKWIEASYLEPIRPCTLMEIAHGGVS